MFKILILYLHLLATCAAIGTIVITDLRLLAKLVGYRVVIPAPQRFETWMVTVSLVGLYLTGATLVWMGQAGNPEYLSNQKLQGKIALVLVLTLNAFVLHHRIFPLLGRGRPVSEWSSSERLTLSGSVAVSNSLWFYCAFLGVARPWNGTVPIGFVLAIAALIWGISFVLVNLGLKLASREQPKPKPDWVDLTIATVSDFTKLGPEHRLPPQVRGANQSRYGDLQIDRRDAARPDRRRAGAR